MPNGNTRIAMSAGAAGGMAEVFWILAAAGAVGTDGWTVARAVGATVVPDLASSRVAPWLGLLIHFLLSFALAAMFVHALRRRLRPVLIFAAALASLAAIWAINFLVLLPSINPAFAALLPHPVTLVSKLLFGVAMAGVLVRNANAAAVFDKHPQHRNPRHVGEDPLE